MSGFATIQRRALDHPLLNDAARLGAWTWLILRASWKPTPFEIAGKIVILERGQICVSRSQLAKAWGMSPSAVERFLTRLETEQMIERATGQGRTVVTICNYGLYQDVGEETGQATGQPTGQPSDSHRTTKEQGNKGTSISEAKASSCDTLAEPDDDADRDDTGDGDEISDERDDLDEAIRCWRTGAERSKWPVPREFTSQRRSKLRSRIREQGLEGWKEALRKALKSALLGHDPPGWFTFDWLTKNPENILKVLEGNYDRSDANRSRPTAANDARSGAVARRRARQNAAEAEGADLLRLAGPGGC